MEESGVKDFHDAKKEASHIGGAIAYKTLGQYGEEAALIVFAVVEFIVTAFAVFYALKK